MRNVCLIFCIWAVSLHATWVGNIAQPALQKVGIIRQAPRNWAFRFGYYGDYVYNQRFTDEFQIGNCEASSTRTKFWTQSGVLTFNFRNRVDLYGMAGSARMEIDKDISTSQQFCWGFGGKIVIFHASRFRVGLDMKYFQTDQEPHFFLCDHYAYNVKSDFYFRYHEIQTALGVSYRTKYLSPYVSGTYLLSKIEPKPMVALVRFPESRDLADAVSKSVIGSNRWGICIGATIVDCRKATLGIEWRGWNQNSVDVTGEIRF